MITLMASELKAQISQLKKFLALADHHSEEANHQVDEQLKLLQSFNWMVAASFIDKYLTRCVMRGIMDHMMWQSTQYDYDQDKIPALRDQFEDYQVIFIRKLECLESDLEENLFITKGD